MKRVGYLFEKVTDFQNLLDAAKKAYKGSHHSHEAQDFWFHLEDELLNLQNELQSGIYRPGQYSYFFVCDPKKRKISVAPFRDRVVHHAVVNVLEPIYEKIFIYDSYATRKGKGTHRAIARAQKFLRKNRWFLKADVHKYFDSVDHTILKTILRKKIKDKRLLQLLDNIIDNGGNAGKGLPIGNLTSQFLANVYLNELDHYLKDQLGIRYYIRYMDDLVVFSDHKEELKQIKKWMQLFLMKKLKLRLKDKATYINQRLNGLTFLGSRIFPNHVRIKRENLKRSLKRLHWRENQFKKGLVEESIFFNSVQSILEHIKIANSRSLKMALFIRANA